MSRPFEVCTGWLTVLVDADDELQALESAVDGGLLEDGEDGSVVEWDGRPVGADGVDPEEGR